MNNTELDFSRYIKLFLSNLVPIIISGIVCVALVFSYNSFIKKPEYRTTATILVNNGSLANTIEGSTIITSGNMSASLYLVTTCVDVLKSDNVYIELSTVFRDKYHYSQLKSMFSVVSRNDNSLLIDISVTGESPDEIKAIANAFLEIIPTYVKNTLPPTDVKILAEATRTSISRPSIFSTAFLSFAAGAALCFFMLLVVGIFKNTIESEEDFKAHYDIPLLGSVPFFETKNLGGK